MAVTLFLFLLVTSLYLGWVLWLYSLWKEIPDCCPAHHDAGHLSIVVPFRNEGGNLNAFIQSLKPHLAACHNAEIIFVDDHSSDDSVQIIEQFQREHSGVFLQKQTETFGKKSGVDLGVSVSTRAWIVALDADIILPENWLNAIASHTLEQQADLLILPLRIGPATNLLSRLQEVEFLSVMGVTASMAFAGKPILCNGANLCFRKEAYNAVRKNRSDFHITSGDDLFLLHALKAEHRIQWVQDVRTIVATQPHTSLSGFLKQRIRWMGKTSRIKDHALRNTAYLTFLMNALVVAGFCSSIVHPVLFPYMVIFLCFKALGDALLIVAVGKWMCIKQVKRFYTLLIFIYPLYATLFPLISILYKPKWKERATNIA